MRKAQRVIIRSQSPPRAHLDETISQGHLQRPESGSLKQWGISYIHHMIGQVNQEIYQIMIYRIMIYQIMIYLFVLFVMYSSNYAMVRIKCITRKYGWKQQVHWLERS